MNSEIGFILVGLFFGSFFTWLIMSLIADRKEVEEQTIRRRLIEEAHKRR